MEVRSASAPEKKRRVAEALEIMRMEQYANRVPNQLSGGQRLKGFEQNPVGIRQVGGDLAVHVRPQDLLVLPPEGEQPGPRPKSREEP